MLTVFSGQLASVEKMILALNLASKPGPQPETTTRPTITPSKAVPRSALIIVRPLRFNIALIGVRTAESMRRAAERDGCQQAHPSRVIISAPQLAVAPRRHPESGLQPEGQKGQKPLDYALEDPVAPAQTPVILVSRSDERAAPEDLLELGARGESISLYTKRLKLTFKSLSADLSTPLADGTAQSFDFCEQRRAQILKLMHADVRRCAVGHNQRLTCRAPLILRRAHARR
jgi:hypothetical protein